MPKLLTNLDAQNVATLVNVPNPVAAGDVANKSYVDSVAQGLQIKSSVRAATVGDISLSGLGTQAGGDWAAPLTAGDRILVRAQSSGVQNGIYLAAAGAWARSGDLPAGSNARSTFVFVEQGATLADSGWVCTNDSGSDVVGTNALSFAQFSGAGMITPGAAISKSGDTLNVLTDGTTVQVNGSNQLEVSPAVRFASHKVVALVGDGVASSFVITHGLGVQSVQVAIREVATNQVVIADVVANTVNQVTVSFAQVPTLNAYAVTIIG